MDESQFKKLLNAAKSDDHSVAGAAIGELVVAISDEIRGSVSKRLYGEMRRLFETDDFLQTVWRVILDKPSVLRKVNSQSDFKGLIVKIGQNRLATAATKNERDDRAAAEHVLIRRSSDPEIEPRAPLPTPSKEVASKEAFDQFWAGLNEEEQNWVRLRSQGKTFEQIAAIVNRNEGTIRKWFRNRRLR